MHMLTLIKLDTLNMCSLFHINSTLINLLKKERVYKLFGLLNRCRKIQHLPKVQRELNATDLLPNRADWVWCFRALNTEIPTGHRAFSPAQTPPFRQGTSSVWRGSYSWAETGWLRRAEVNGNPSWGKCLVTPNTTPEAPVGKEAAQVYDLEGEAAFVSPKPVPTMICPEPRESWRLFYCYCQASTALSSCGFFPGIYMVIMSSEERSIIGTKASRVLYEAANSRLWSWCIQTA